MIHRCVGPPGCGKTTWVSRQAKKATEQYGGDSVAIASLTRTAAREVASRATGVPQDQIGTLHSLAWHRMNRPAVCQTVKGIKDWNQSCGSLAYTLSGKTVASPDAELSDGYGTGEGGDELFAEMNVLRSRMIDRRMWRAQVRGFAERWEQWKASNGYVDFTDMIEKAIEQVDDLGVDILVLDEAQDMSRLEMTLARKWGAAADQLVVVGDPDQNLYEWRGSEPDVFYDGEAATSRVLAQSYRVPRAVHHAAVEWIEQVPGREPVEYLPTDDDGALQRHHSVCYQDPQGMAHLVEKLAEDGSSVMVLTSCSFMLVPLIAELKDRGIPFHNPYRVKNAAWNPLSAKRVEKMLAFLRMQNDVWGSESRMWRWDDIAMWSGAMLAKGVMRHGKKDWIRKKGMRDRFDDDEDLAVGSIQDVLDCFTPDHWDSILEADPTWWLRHLDHKNKQRQQYICNIALQHGGAVLRQTPKITVGTIHSVKGGEADKVVLAPDLSRAGMEQWMSRKRGPIYRQFYVGMTRARKELHIIGNATSDKVTI